MSKSDRLIPGAAFFAVLVAAIVVVGLLHSASTNGSKALEDLKLAQVVSTANSFNARIDAEFSSISGVTGRPWDLTLNSPADMAVLQAFNVDPKALSGYFLVNGADTITNGILLRPGELGSKYNPAGWARLKAALATSPVIVLPVARNGLTTELPAYAYAFAIRGASPTNVRGVVIYEQAVSADSAFNAEIQATSLGGHSTAALRFLDSNGTVVPPTLPSGLGERVPDRQLANLSNGLHHIGADIVASATARDVGWTVVFSQRESEFVGPLASPLKTAGLVLLMLFAVGIIFIMLLGKRLRQAREADKKLRELHSAQEEFVSVVSHELRTPVSGVLGFLQTTIDHWGIMTDEERQSGLLRAFANARRLQAMARDVLDSESMETGQFGYLTHPLDIGDEIRTAVETLEQGGREVTMVLPDAPVMVSADADRIQQVLANLLDNALKHSPVDSAVEIALSQVGAVARVSVVDHGAGIDPEQLVRIFEKFVRAREGSLTGTGLGLYISRRIIEAHGGRIWAESGPGLPTTFIFELPCQVDAPASREFAGQHV